MRTRRLFSLALVVAVAGCRDAVEPGRPATASLELATTTTKPITLDVLVFETPTTIPIGGVGLTYTATITNHTTLRRSRIAMQAWVEQAGGAFRAAGGHVVSCGTELSVLPPGTCVVPLNGLAASNGTAGRGTLVPGDAWAVIAVVELRPTGPRVLDRRDFPIKLTASPVVLKVDVAPAHAELGYGERAQLSATVYGTGGLPTSVTWSTSDATVATVDVNGLVTGVSPGAALVTATSTADPTKSANALVTVGFFTPSFGNGVNVSPSGWWIGVGGSVPIVAQVTGGQPPVQWSSSDPSVATVSANGIVTAVGAGAARITATSDTSQASSYITVYDMLLTDPAPGTLVSTGATNPPAHSLSAGMQTSISVPINTSASPPITQVSFYALVGSTWTQIASAPFGVVVQTSVERLWLWNSSWTPGSSVGTGNVPIMAKAWFGSKVVAVARLNSFVTITDP